MKQKPVVPIKASTQRFTEINDIVRDIVLFADGSCTLIVTTTAVNFGLLVRKGTRSNHLCVRGTSQLTVLSDPSTCPDTTERYLILP